MEVDASPDPSLDGDGEETLLMDPPSALQDWLEEAEAKKAREEAEPERLRPAIQVPLPSPKRKREQRRKLLASDLQDWLEEAEAKKAREEAEPERRRPAIQVPPPSTKRKREQRRERKTVPRRARASDSRGSGCLVTGLWVVAWFHGLLFAAAFFDGLSKALSAYSETSDGGALTSALLDVLGQSLALGLLAVGPALLARSIKKSEGRRMGRGRSAAARRSRPAQLATPSPAPVAKPQSARMRRAEEIKAQIFSNMDAGDRKKLAPKVDAVVEQLKEAEELRMKIDKVLAESDLERLVEEVKKHRTADVRDDGAHRRLAAQLEEELEYLDGLVETRVGIELQADTLLTELRQLRLAVVSAGVNSALLDSAGVQSALQDLDRASRQVNRDAKVARELHQLLD